MNILQFKKKSALVYAAASCLPSSANVAFAQDFGVTHGIESKDGFPSVVCDNPQLDYSSVIKDGRKRDELSGVWCFGKGKHQTGWFQTGDFWYWLDSANDSEIQTGYSNVILYSDGKWCKIDF